MPWFHVDDGFHSHPKALATSLSARGLWVTAGSWSSAHLTDGVVPDQVLVALGSTPELVAELVAAGLWKRVRSGYRFHEWNGNGNPSKQAVENERRASARRQALWRDPALKEAVRNRDAGCCRYCGRRVRWGKGKAPDSGSYDHVDPKGANELSNLVVACFACNAAKRDRTPEEAGMTLLKVPERNASTEASSNASVAPSITRSSYRTSTPGGRGSATTAPPGKSKPPWCGMCDKDTRLTGPADQPYRCPACHPYNARSTP